MAGSFRLHVVMAVAAALVLLASPRGAFAQATLCVQVDSDRDTLTAEEQRAAWSLLVQAFEKEGVAIDAGGEACGGVYVVYNVRLGDSINITIHGPNGRRDGRAARIDELPQVYSQMVKSLLSGQPMTNDSGAVDRTNVTTEQTAPKRVAAESLKYVKLGYGGVTARDGYSAGPGFGFGYRYELDQIALDGSINLVVASDTEDAGVSGSFIKLMAMRFFDPIANSTPYGGLGVSWGGSAVEVDGETYTGGGLQAEVSFGYELLRASTIRLFGGVDFTLPLYFSDADLFSGGSSERWTPTILFSVGGGIGKVRTVRVIND